MTNEEASRESFECIEIDSGDSVCAGFAIVDGNAIRLICVLHEFRRKGIGSALLKESEKYIKAQGHDKAILGGTSSGFMIGADERAWGFFEKRGYKRTAGSTEMLMKLKDFELEKYSFRGSAEAKFGWYRELVEKGEIAGLGEVVPRNLKAEKDVTVCAEGATADEDEMTADEDELTADEDEMIAGEKKVTACEDSALQILHEAVRSVDETWVPLYTGIDNVYVGVVDGKIASFCTVELDAQNYLTDVHGRVGMPGCVGTVPSYRKRGIALEMVAYATQYLKEQGMDVSFIYFTRVAPFYERIGYETFMEEVFAEKELYC